MLMASSLFDSRLSPLESMLRRWSGALRRYWQFGRFIYIALLAGVILPALVQQPGNLFHSTTVRVLLRFWPTIIVIVFLGISMVIAWEAERDWGYYRLLNRSADNYHRVRRGYRAIAAQLPDYQAAIQLPESSDTEEPLDGLAIFDHQLYTERAQALAIYAEFVRQQKKRILLIVGDGGSGKSTFLLHRMGELSGALPSKVRPHPCVFVNCKLDHLTDMSELVSIIQDKLGEGLSDILSKNVRQKRSRALVIFVDAINENVAPVRDDVNVHLTKFADDYLNPKHKHEIYLCVSVRKTYWDEQRRRFSNNPTSAELGWLNYVYRPSSGTTLASGAETASMLLENFAGPEFDAAYEKYREVYRIEGTIPDERTRNICSNPLMLQVFCISFYNQDIRDLDIIRNLVRDLDVFDKYAGGALVRAADDIGIRADEPVRDGETFAERAIRGLLLEIALGMVEHGRPFLSDDEVFHIAQTRAPDALVIGGQRIETVSGLYREGSALKAILSEGIILERSKAILNGRHSVSGIRFVFERYLEYSIGRALVRRWRLDNSEPDQIFADFRRLMGQHVLLRGQGFDNLRLGLGIAVLVAEQTPDDFPRPIHLDLLRILGQDAEFDWNQLACRVMMQLRTFNRADLATANEHYSDVDALLAILDGLAEKNDFVIRWDIERALVRAVDAGEGHAVLEHMRAWMKSTAAFSQRLFSGESLGYLFKQRADYRQEVIGVLKEIVETSSTLDFWILRSLMFSVGTMMDALESDAAPGPADTSLEDELRRLPGKLLELSRNWWDRSVVIADQIERDAMQDKLSPWLGWLWGDESPWTRVNAALATEQACIQGRCGTNTVRLLESLWLASTDYDPHVSWAVWHVLGQAIASGATPEESRLEAPRLRSQIAEVAGQHRSDPRAAWVLRAQDASADDIPAGSIGPVTVVYHPEYGHTDLHNHPESKERVQAILDFLQAQDHAGAGGREALLSYVSPYSFRDWEDQEFLRKVHGDGWIRRVQELSSQLAAEDNSDIMLESDLEVRAGSYEGAALAVRGAVCAVDLVTSMPSVRLALALVRPPGHLAGNKICIFNNIAVAARYGQQVIGAKNGDQKPHVLIVDCDAHHGKNTQDVFYQDGTVMYFSVHQAGVHPGTGRFTERGKGDGAGCVVNVPIPARSGDRVYIEVLQRILQPILNGFKPELILVSLGFDAYCEDSFSQLNLTERSYSEFAAVLLRYCQEHPAVRVAASLEGGYDLNSMGSCLWQFVSTFCEWASPADHESAASAGTSWLDRYLLERDAGNPVTAIADRDHQQWHEDFVALETALRNQWPTTENVGPVRG
jgi:acetoin utilization deacetylase AcuC-like enzyme